MENFRIKETEIATNGNGVVRNGKFYCYNLDGFCKVRTKIKNPFLYLTKRECRYLMELYHLC